MLESLEVSVDRQRRFVADAAHELRTPLPGLTTALEVARSHPRTSETLVDDLLAGHRRLGRLVNDLLILAPSMAAHRIGAEPVDLAGVATDCSRRPVPHGVSLRLGHLDRVLVLGDETHTSGGPDEDLGTVHPARRRPVAGQRRERAGGWPWSWNWPPRTAAVSR